MEMILDLKQTEEGYVAKLDKLPEFSGTFFGADDKLESLPTMLKSFVADWEASNQVKTTKYQEEFPYILRIKSRSFYQATVYRIQEILAIKSLKQLDLEELHGINQEDFLAMSSHLSQN